MIDAQYPLVPYMTDRTYDIWAKPRVYAAFMSLHQRHKSGKQGRMSRCNPCRPWIHERRTFPSGRFPLGHFAARTLPPPAFEGLARKPVMDDNQKGTMSECHRNGRGNVRRLNVRGKTSEEGICSGENILHITPIRICCTI